MTVKRSGLGRNLSVLLGQQPSAVQSNEPVENSQLNLALSCLQPGKYQPRTEFPEESLSELAKSIKQQGLLQPLIVRKISPDRYEIIAGERRWRACQLAGLKEAPVIIRQVDDETAMALALIENLQREDLNVMDQARAMHRLVQEFSLTHQQIADLLAKSRTAVSNYLRLLTLSGHVKKLLENGDLDMGHARALLTLPEAMQKEVADVIVAKDLSVRETEQLVKRVQTGKPDTPPPPDLHPQIRSQLDQLAAHLKTAINVKPGKAGKGRLVIHYNSVQDLESVIQQIVRA